MRMPSSRYFLTNLPLDTTEEDLRTVFSKYAPVTLVELKTKENALEDGILKFAFVTVELSSEDAEYYLREIKWETIRGSRVKVSIAKESFLERLKRERENEANESSTAKKPLEAQNDQRKSVVFPESQQNTRRIFAEDEDLDDDIPADLLITKKRAARSIQNGKIVIEESGLEPLHVIEKQKKIKNDKTTKTAITAEAKRKESVNKMKNQYDQKKNAIKEALSGVNVSMSNKIKFSDAEEDDDEVVPKRKTDIFGTENENDEDISDLNLNYGKKGDKLAKMRSQRQNLDARFKIDENFIDGDDDADEDGDGDDKDEEPNEREWQLNILEQVVGYKLDKSTAAEKAARSKKMIRYDPSKTEHEKLLRQKVSDTKKDKNSKAQEPESKPAPVSQDVFYVVSDTFSQAIKTRGEGFSLLNMFGSQAVSAELEQREDNLKQLKDERILVNKLNRNATNNVKYESSSSGEDEEENSTINKVNQNEGKQQKVKGKKKKVAIIMETFFFKPNDQRLKEGTEFFKYDKLKDIADEDYEPVRRKLNLLIKKKISKTKKNRFGAARKPLKNKKKKV